MAIIWNESIITVKSNNSYFIPDAQFQAIIDTIATRISVTLTVLGFFNYCDGKQEWNVKIRHRNDDLKYTETHLTFKNFSITGIESLPEPTLEI